MRVRTYSPNTRAPTRHPRGIQSSNRNCELPTSALLCKLIRLLVCADFSASRRREGGARDAPFVFSYSPSLSLSFSYFFTLPSLFLFFFFFLLLSLHCLLVLSRAFFPDSGSSGGCARDPLPRPTLQSRCLLSSVSTHTVKQQSFSCN